MALLQSEKISYNPITSQYNHTPYSHSLIPTNPHDKSVNLNPNNYTH